MRLDAVILRVVVVAVIHRRPPVGGRLAAQHRRETPPLHVVGHRQPGEGHERRREVRVQHHAVAHRAGLRQAGNLNQQRHAQGMLIHEPFVEPAVVAEVKAVVARVKDDRVFHQAVLFQIVEDAPHVVVHRGHAAQVVLHVALIFPLLQRRPREARGRCALRVVSVEVAVDAHRRLGRRRRAGRVVVVESRRLRDFHVVVHVRVLRVRFPRPVRRFRVREKQERFVLRPLFQKLDRLVRDDVAHVALDRLLRPHLDELRIVIPPLSRQDAPVIETRRIAAQMPLPDHPRVIARGLEILRHCRLRAVEAVENRHAVAVRILARH